MRKFLQYERVHNLTRGSINVELACPVKFLPPALIRKENINAISQVSQLKIAVYTRNVS